jgi:hypothetical protein
MSAQTRRQIKTLLIRFDYYKSVGNHSEAARIAQQMDEIIQEER